MQHLLGFQERIGVVANIKFEAKERGKFFRGSTIYNMVLWNKENK